MYPSLRDILQTTITRNAERDTARATEVEIRRRRNLPTPPRQADEAKVEAWKRDLSKRKTVPKSAWDRILEDD